MNKSATKRIICAALSAISALALCGCSAGNSGRRVLFSRFWLYLFLPADGGMHS